MSSFAQSGYESPMWFFNDRLDSAIKAAQERDRQHQEAEAAREAAEAQERAIKQRKKDNFIESVALERATPYRYAEWLMLWMYQGGAVHHFYGYDLPSYVLTPTRHNPFAEIPEMFGADAFQLLVDDPVARIDMTPISRRAGWEWGHSDVKRIMVLDDGTYKAYTNNPDSITAYADVVALIRQGGIDMLRSVPPKHLTS